MLRAFPESAVAATRDSYYGASGFWDRGWARVQRRTAAAGDSANNTLTGAKRASYSPAADR